MTQENIEWQGVMSKQLDEQVKHLICLIEDGLPLSDDLVSEIKHLISIKEKSERGLTNILNLPQRSCGIPVHAGTALVSINPLDYGCPFAGSSFNLHPDFHWSIERTANGTPVLVPREKKKTQSI